MSSDFQYHGVGALPVALPAADALDALGDAMRAERRLLDELLATLERQRAAVAHDDLDALDDTVFGTHRILRTLTETRRRRRHALLLLGETGTIGVHDLAATLDDRMTIPLRIALDALQLSARALAEEVETNRHLLEVTMAAEASAPPCARAAPAA